MKALATMTITEVRSWVDQSSLPPSELLALLMKDQRQGVRQLAGRIQLQLAKIERARLQGEKMLQFERALWRRGFKWVAGVDEAGCGPLAGPVVAAAVVWPYDLVIPGLNDSKQLTEHEREHLYEEILAAVPAVAVEPVDNLMIDQINIRQADLLAMEQAVFHLAIQPDYLLTDAWRLPRWPTHQLGIFDGDATCLSIAAASVVAKVTRDRLMVSLDRQYPGYGFAQHKGYPTPAHWEALKRLGPSPIHRRSFLGRLQGGPSL